MTLSISISADAQLMMIGMGPVMITQTVHVIFTNIHFLYLYVCIGISIPYMGPFGPYCLEPPTSAVFGE